MNKPIESWDVVIKPVHGWFNINFKEIVQYWDLILLFVNKVQLHYQFDFNIDTVEFSTCKFKSNSTFTFYTEVYVYNVQPLSTSNICLTQNMSQSFKY